MLSVNMNVSAVLEKGLLILVSLLFSIPSLSQNPTILIRDFKVIDGYTQDVLEHAKVSVFEEDSVTLLVDSMGLRVVTYNGSERNVFGFYANVPLRTGYVLRVECKNYPTEWVHHHVRKRGFKIEGQYFF